MLYAYGSNLIRGQTFAGALTNSGFAIHDE